MQSGSLILPRASCSGSNRVHMTGNVPFAYDPGKWWQRWAADRGYGVGSFLGPLHPKCGIKGPAGPGRGQEGNPQKSYFGAGKPGHHQLNLKMGTPKAACVLHKPRGWWQARACLSMKPASRWQSWYQEMSKSRVRKAQWYQKSGNRGQVLEVRDMGRTRTSLGACSPESLYPLLRL